MESMGGALFVDGEWESLCKLFSTEQDLTTDHLLGYNSNPPKSHLPEDEDLISLIMGNTINPISSSFFTEEANLAPNSNQLPQSCSSDLSCDSSNGGSPHYVNGFNNLVQPNANEDQISCLSSFDCFLEEGLMMGQLGVPDVIDREAGDHPSATKRNSMEAEVPKKRARVSKHAGKRKTRNEDVEEETNGDSNVQNSNGDISDNESNDSQEVIDEKPKEILNMNGKRRANRGAATDPQSLYARRRRERINERLRILQSLVPNGTKVDISTMLEEAVNYVKFLQLQIKLLSSDEMWMYAPLAYSGFDMGLYKRFSPFLPRP